MQHFRKNRDAPESDPARFVEAVTSSILNVDPEVWIASSKELVASLRDWMNRWNSRGLISDADLCKEENFIGLFRGLRLLKYTIRDRFYSAERASPFFGIRLMLFRESLTQER